VPKPSPQQQPAPNEDGARSKASGAKKAEEIFERLDADKNGHWSLKEASQLMVITFGLKMPARTFEDLLSAANPTARGKRVSDREFNLGLSKSQVVNLYTDEDLRSEFEVVPLTMNLDRDHAAVSQKGPAPRKRAKGIDQAADEVPDLD